MYLLGAFARLLQELPAGSDGAALSVAWQVRGEFVPEAGGAGHNWLYLQVQTQLPQTCQRCLQPVQVALEVDRAFRFVKDEATAEALDDECDEDLLVMSRSFDLMALVIFLAGFFVLRKWKPSPIKVMAGAAVAGVVLYSIAA